MSLRAGQSDAASNWFAAQVRPGRERLCAQHLSVRGYETFLPCYRERRRWSDRVKTVERPLFGGYVFCRIAGEVFGTIVSTPGVIRLVGEGRRPLPIEAHEIEALQCMTAAGLWSEPSEFLHVGQRVRVIAGPLAGYEGIVLRTKNQHRLVISVSLLRRSVAVEIHPDWVCSLGRPPAAPVGRRSSMALDAQHELAAMSGSSGALDAYAGRCPAPVHI